jgi:tRNA pseudouridine55 synthase
MVAADGLLVIDKPAGWTSHDVVARGRQLAGTRKVGHAGTLDPMATGVLVLGIGRATRLLGHLALTTKGYCATIRLGRTTVTDDADGDALVDVDASSLSDEQVAGALAAFRGDIEQVPSSVSAVKIRGERAYKRVRSGEQVEIPARRVHISALSLLAVERTGPFVDAAVTVECSSGTYIRALARDLGHVLGVGGHLTRLRRVRVGPFTAREAHDLDALAALEPAALPVVSLDDVARECFASYVVDEAQVTAVRNGRPLEVRLDRSAPLPAAGTEPDADRPGAAAPVAVLAPGGRFLALYEQHGPTARPVAVFDPA